jgi:hypothetical protein
MDWVHVLPFARSMSFIKPGTFTRRSTAQIHPTESVSLHLISAVRWEIDGSRHSGQRRPRQGLRAAVVPWAAGGGSRMGSTMHQLGQNLLLCDRGETGSSPEGFICGDDEWKGARDNGRWPRPSAAVRARSRGPPWLRISKTAAVGLPHAWQLLGWGRGVLWRRDGELGKS